MVNCEKEKLNIKTTVLSEVLKTAFEYENLKYDEIHPSYNIKNTKNDDQILFVTCYVVKNEPYSIHIDNRLESNKWVVDVVIMSSESSYIEKVEDILRKANLKTGKYNGECNGEFEGHIKIEEFAKIAKYEEIRKLNVKLLKLFQ